MPLKQIPRRTRKLKENGKTFYALFLLPLLGLNTVLVPTHTVYDLDLLLGGEEARTGGVVREE